MLKTASWVNVRRFFPDVTKPLFHATTGGKAASIALYKQGVKSDSGVSNFGEGNGDGGISMSRNLDFLLKGGFGNVIFVFDERELSSRYRVDPVAYGSSSGWEDEYEERVYAKTIPVKLIRGVIFRYGLRRFEAEEWTTTVGYPVVHHGDSGWVCAQNVPIVSKLEKDTAMPSSLRNATIKIAFENPELREQLLPLLAKEAGVPNRQLANLKLKLTADLEKLKQTIHALSLFDIDSSGEEALAAALQKRIDGLIRSI